MTPPSCPFPLDQYEALREGCGLVELAEWSSVTIAGGDRQPFLHGFCTNDVRRLVPGESCEAFVTDVKGKTIGHGLITCRENELVYITVPGQAESLAAHWDRYVIREDVRVRDTTAERAYLLLAGREEAGSLAADVGGAAVRWIVWNLLAGPMCGLLEVMPTDVPRVRQSLVERGAVACEAGAFAAARIEAGTPLFGIDFGPENLPQEVGRDKSAISFTKGCYLGQETIARIDALGHVNQQLTGARFAGPRIPATDTALTHAGAAIGRVTSATFSPRLGAPLALAMVRRPWFAPGGELESEVGPCKVVALPVGSSDGAID